MKVIFFDGRGGTPARGGGKNAPVLRKPRKNIANNKIELTIKGQTITWFWKWIKFEIYLSNF